MPYFRSKYFFKLSTAGLISCFVFSACENDLKKIKEISELEVIKPVERSKDVEIIFSDSAKVKAKVEAPVMLNHTVAKPYREMPNGVKITFYENLKPVNVITAEHGIQRESENLIELHKNVVAKNEQGDIFKSEELIWDGKNKKIRSTQPVQIFMKNGDIINGTGFESNESFYPYTLDNTTGIFNVNENPGFTQ
ncbi:LPS export ABC transporter periplasmic protein LptC [Mucilaginibacter limnophilus]|uniref:LPS export ABC transporter periplasmic protein LptC n=1 Tax=Mucilaginibacter limnophilus TaxID=1932778 RepID=A0A437MW35_9SPHI|nr:LPS export ABC transporter periplasmic protein LptC [Mucilaginibacter limnophilus]RVU01880.1 LPS export ABC transporter periplasmic protein LptC [Mucilaginibacter limnophilus]